MTQHQIVPVRQIPSTEIYQHQNGRTYLVRKQADGQVLFTPIEAIAQHFHPTQVTPIPALPPSPEQPSSRQQDPLAIFLAGLGVILLITIGGYFLGFVAGKNGQSVVIVPRSPVCDTRRSSFLFWSNEQKECQ